MLILGVTHPISWNPAAALLRDGHLVAMAEEERFNRLKYAPRLSPDRAIRYCLDEAGAALGEVDAIAVGWESGRRQKRKKRFAWEFLAGKFPFSRKDPRIRYVRHHLAHAAASFFASGFESALILSLDAYGGSDSGLLGVGEGGDIRVLHSVPTKASWGHMYGKLTERLGFRFHADEGKVMGLAAFGTPCPDTVDFIEWDRRIPRIDPKRFRDFLERAPSRPPGGEILQEHKDLAATAQWILERAVIRMARALHEDTGRRNLVLSGGTALNCSMNGALHGQDFLDEVFVNPAAHDAGTALGAALWVHREITGVRPDWTLTHPFFGPAFDSALVEKAVRTSGISNFRRVESPEEEAVGRLVSGEIIGWFQGRMEFGPRALGNRSILADPGARETADRVNDIKGRERWRPLAPSIPEEEVARFVNGAGPIRSPFMLKAFHAGGEAERSLPAVVHVDGTMRIQTVSKVEQPRFWNLLRLFGEKTGRPALLNTSFNLAGQPIVCTPRDALGTFFASGLDALVMEDFVVWK